MLEVDLRVVAEPQRRLVENPQKERGQRRGGLLDFIEQDECQIAGRALGREQTLGGQHRFGLAVTEVAGRRANQLRDFVIGLVVSAVDLDHALGVAVEHLGERFDRAGLSGACGAEQKEDAAGRSGGLSPPDTSG